MTGARAVTGTGSASVTHHVAISTATPATRQATGDMASGGGTNSAKAKKARPAARPAMRTLGRRGPGSCSTDLEDMVHSPGRPYGKEFVSMMQTQRCDKNHGATSIMVHQIQFL